MDAYFINLIANTEDSKEYVCHKQATGHCKQPYTKVLAKQKAFA